ncbi:TPA_exp: Integral membrane protein [Trichophyton benhamiae CBS 112371]|nr:TPA_exp: Integral membrane protein [Trichophyton benhamiae CBS 112371]
MDPSKTPLAPNPSGGPSNFVDPPTLDSAILSLGVVLISISMLCLTIRLITNYKHTGRLGPDDYLCVFGEAAAIGYWAIIESDGVARHSWDVPASVVTKSFIKRQFAQQMIVAPALWATKSAVLVLYIRIFSSVRWISRVSYGLIVLTFLVYGINIILATVYCLPRNGAPWDATAFARCAEPVTLAIFIGSFTVLADFIIFLLPFPIIRKLQMAQAKKVGLAIVFLVGFTTVIMSITSLGFRIQLFLGEDPVWNGLCISLTTFAELFGTVIPSTVYSTLRSRLLISKTKSNPDNQFADEERIELPSKLRNGHDSWPGDSVDGLGGKTGPFTRIYSSSSSSIPMKNAISKAIHISQSQAGPDTPPH